jgi:hypothetical protein
VLVSARVVTQFEWLLDSNPNLAKLKLSNDRSQADENETLQIFFA